MNAKINVYVFFSVLELISLVSESFSSGMIFMAGSLRTSLLAIFLSNDNSNDGNNNKLESIANKSVAETKAPNATVPPKLEMVNTEKPKNNTIDV